MNNLHGLQEMTAHFSNSCNLLKTKLNEENSEIEHRNKPSPEIYEMWISGLKRCFMLTKTH